MMRHCKLIISVVTMALIFSIFPISIAHADPFTATQIAGTAYAMMQSWGIAFTAGASTDPDVMSQFMSDNVETYVSEQGSTVANTFVGSIAVDVAGKLVVGHSMYNAIIDFVDWLKDKYTLSSSDFSLIQGEYNNTILPYSKPSSTISGVGYEVMPSDYIEEYHNPDRPQDDYVGGWRYMAIYNQGALQTQRGISWGSFFFTGKFEIVKETNTQGNTVIVCYLYTIGWKGGASSPVRVNIGTVYSELPNSLDWNGADFVEPVVLNPNKEWIGDIDGYSAHDTNLDQLVGDIFDAVADNSLDVDGEVIDIPIPPEPTPVPPTPIPINPDTPLSDVPWEGLDNNLQDLYEQGLEEIGTIADGFNNVIDSIENAIGDVIEWLESIYEKIESVGLDLIDALENILEAIQEIADAIVNGEANWFNDVVDAILTPFRPWINALKSATGIWHYIVEWLQCIATPFGFFWGVLSGIGACFVRPIYAVAAFAVVIAIYKRFGK